VAYSRPFSRALCGMLLEVGLSVSISHCSLYFVANPISLHPFRPPSLVRGLPQTVSLCLSCPFPWQYVSLLALWSAPDCMVQPVTPFKLLWFCGPREPGLHTTHPGTPAEGSRPLAPVPGPGTSLSSSDSALPLLSLPPPPRPPPLPPCSPPPTPSHPPPDDASVSVLCPRLLPPPPGTSGGRRESSEPLHCRGALSPVGISHGGFCSPFYADPPPPPVISFA